jgi:septum formation protein
MADIDSNIFPEIPVLERAQVVLASGSPRRKELMGRLMGAKGFKVVSTDIDESQLPGEEPIPHVTRLAQSKAQAGAKQLVEGGAETLIIGADTIVLMDGRIYGKPANQGEAASYLSQLSGRTHQVITAVAAVLVSAEREIIRQEVFNTTSEVEFRAITQAEVEWYVATNEPNDKAGAYAIQGYGGLLIAGIGGDYYNIVGLPIGALIELLRKF